ncbi:hypothetical protein T492DRAFT_847045 [Pavlovales sp. CCMP2436]|nr:hypothetical protein T492DRAFT_847045 [Pavlovales sp. CCMP2436]
MCDWGVMEEAHPLRTRRPPTHHALLSPWCADAYDADKLYFRPVTRCLGDGPAHAPLLAYARAFHAHYAAAGLPALSWGVLLEGHEPTGVGAASLDADLAAHLGELERAHGESLALLLLSDHGIHYGQLFDTDPAGAREHLAPPLYAALPNRWLNEHPRAAANLCANRGRLVSPFDVHATLAHLLALPRAGEFPRWHRPARHAPRSLFEPIPSQRTCEEAWCISSAYTRGARDTVTGRETSTRSIIIQALRSSGSPEVEAGPRPEGIDDDSDAKLNAVYLSWRANALMSRSADRSARSESSELGDAGVSISARAGVSAYSSSESSSERSCESDLARQR